MLKSMTRLQRMAALIPMTSEEICKKLSMNRNTYYAYISAKRNAAMMPALQFFRLASILRVDPTELLDAAIEDHRDKVYRSEELYKQLNK